jgi:maltose alpha-D-glucosyltransferase/alpha-amylase
MQWSPDRNGGFSRADPQRLYLPPVMDPVYGYETVNVEAQHRSPSSLLNWTRQLIAMRKSYRAFGRGTLRFLDPGNRKVLAYVREWQDEKLLCVANLSRSAQPVELNLADYKGRVPEELLGRTAFPPIGELPYLLTLQGHGFYAFRLASDLDAPSWHQDQLPTRELPLLVLTDGWDTFDDDANPATSAVRRAIAARTQDRLQHEVLVPYLLGARWFADKGRPIVRVEFVEQDEWRTPEGQWLMALIAVHFADDGPSQRYFLPLAIAWDNAVSEEKRHAVLGWALARVREKSRVGVLHTALGDDDFCRALLRAIDGNQRVPLENGEIVFRATGAVADLAQAAALPVQQPGLEQSNTSIFFGDRLFLKVYRRLQDGTNPEVEIGCFLTEHAPDVRSVPVAGVIEYRRADGAVSTLGLLQAFVENQGSAWDYVAGYLERFLNEPVPEAVPELPPGQPAVDPNPHAFLLQELATLGRRTAELHQALGRTTGDPAFDPEPVDAGELARWVDGLRDDVARTFDRLAGVAGTLPESLRDVCQRLLAQRAGLVRSITPPELAGARVMRSRYHGDFHLGQVLLAHGDFVLIDFEGEPARPLAERRAKHSPLRDVAGMLRSFAYAAAVAVNRASAEHPADRPRLSALAEGWERQAAAAYLDGYRAAIAGCPTWPADEGVAMHLIGLFTVEKTLYEIRYELDNRPEWLPVPVVGLQRHIGAGAPGI